MKFNEYVGFLKGYYFKNKLRVTFLFGITILQSFIAICIPLIYKGLIDKAFPNQDITLFALLIIIMMLLFTFNAILSIVKDYQLAIFAETLSFTLRKKLNNKLSLLNQSFYDSNKLSDILSRYNKEIETIKINCGYMVIKTVTNATTLLLSSMMIMLFDWRLLIITVLIIMLYILVNKYYGKNVKKYAELVMVKNEKSINQLAETYNNVLITKTYDAYDYVEKKFENQYESQYRDQLKLELIYSKNINFGAMLIFFLSGFIWLVGGLGIIQGDKTVGEVVAIISYQSMMLGPARFFCEFYNSYKGTLVSMKRLNDIFNSEEEGVKKLKACTSIEKIIVDNLNFSYGNNSKKQLVDVNAEFSSGNIYGIIGSSGSGKSTLVKLLLGLYQPNSGSITVDGDVLSHLDIKNYRENIAYIPQDSIFFNDTIVSNVLFGNSVEKSILESRGERIGLSDDIQQFQDGWETVLQPNGKNISGGQKKRIDILRALVKDADLLIFDEPSASLDPKRRELFYRELKKIKSNKIIIVITHNLDEVLWFDTVYEIDNGVLIRK